MDNFAKMSIQDLCDQYEEATRFEYGVKMVDARRGRVVAELERRTRSVHPAGAVGEALDRWQRVAKGESLRSVYDRPNEAWSYNRAMEYAADDNAILAAAFADQFKGESALSRIRGSKRTTTRTGPRATSGGGRVRRK